MKIIIGSKNPVKLEAVRQAFVLHFGNTPTLEVIGIDAPSGVADQPMSAEETATGAVNRAKHLVLLHTDADYHVGIEGGITKLMINGESHYFEQTYACVSNGKQHALGSGPAYGIEDKVIEHIDNGLDLSQAMHKIYGAIDLGKRDGYNGWLSQNKYDRTEASKIAVFLALQKLLLN